MEKTNTAKQTKHSKHSKRNKHNKQGSFRIFNLQKNSTRRASSQHSVVALLQRQGGQPILEETSLLFIFKNLKPAGFVDSNGILLIRK